RRGAKVGSQGGRIMSERHVAASSVWVLLPIVMLAALVPLRADEKDDAKSESAARLKELVARVNSVTLKRRNDSGTDTLEPLKEPLLRYSDPARSLQDAAVFTYGSKGRPVA